MTDTPITPPPDEQVTPVAPLRFEPLGRGERAINRAKAQLDHLEALREKLRQAQKLMREMEEML
jgi:hypothetical protein